MKFSIKYKFRDLYLVNLFLLKQSLVIRLFGVYFSYNAFINFIYHDKLFGVEYLVLALLSIPHFIAFFPTLTAFYKGKKNISSTEVLINTEGIKTESTKVKSEYSWEAFTQYDNDTNTMILYRDKLIQIFFLKYMFSNEQQ